jgi:hypothetical protein
VTREETKRYNRYLRKLRGLSWNAYTAMMEAEHGKPEAEQHPAMDDPMFVKACAAFERCNHPHGGGRGRIPSALRGDGER